MDEEGDIAYELTLRGFELRQAGRHGEAIDAYRSVVDRFGASDDPYVLSTVADARYGTASALSATGDNEAALRELAALITHHGASDDADVLLSVAYAHVARGATLKSLDRLGAALAAFDEALRIVATGTDDQRWIQLEVETLDAKARTLGRHDRADEAVVVTGLALRRVGQTSGLQTFDGRDLAGVVRFHHAILLGRAGRRGEAIAILDELEAHFAGSKAARAGSRRRSPAERSSAIRCSSGRSCSRDFRSGWRSGRRRSGASASEGDHDAVDAPLLRGRPGRRRCRRLP